MNVRKKFVAHLASLPLETRRLAMAHLAHLIKQRRSPTWTWSCLDCQERIAALVRAIQLDSDLPLEHCPTCQADWRTLDGTVPPGPTGFPVLPDRRPLLRFGLAEALNQPISTLPEDAELVRAFSIIHLITLQGGNEELLAKALQRTLGGKPPHQRWAWEERIEILQRKLVAHRGNPAVAKYCKWCRGDLVDLLNSEVLLAPCEVELLRHSSPELYDFVRTLPEIQHLIEDPS